MSSTYSRRRFLRKSATLVMAVPGLSRAHTLLQPQGVGSLQPEGLEQEFQHPPDAAWPWVYWFASDGNITREGITADLEAMHRVGIRGVLYMEVDQYVPKGPVRFLSPQWREMIQHAEKEAERLGISLNMNNDGGWCGSGGPWITPDLSMQMLVWSETSLQGPNHFTGKLLQPKTVENYYQDIAVLAFPTPAGETVRMAECSPLITYGADRKTFDFAKLIDGNPGTTVTVPMPEAGEAQYLNIEFPEPFTAQALTVALDTWNSQIHGTIEVSDDGKNFRAIRPITLRWPVSSVNFKKTTARYYRIVLNAQNDWFYQQFAHGIRLGEVDLHADLRIEDIPGKAAYNRQDEFAGEPELAPEMAIRRDQVIEISARMDRDGRVHWEVPDGKWTLLRIGHTSTGKTNHPAPKESMGLECDKLSKKAVEVQFAGLLGKLLEDQAAIGGKALTMTHIDSWEVGSQNWTPGFREEFQRRYGYDLLPYLPVLTGRAVESREVSERFLWDLRRIVADLLLENYAGHMQEISHQHGLTLSIEAYGAGPLEEVAYGGRADVPMSEFWIGQTPGTWNKEMASSGHVYGRPIIGAESFTSVPPDSKWQSHPYRVKPLGDLAFSQGINRFVLCFYTMQPWADRKPGMTLGPWGFHYERSITWWEQSRVWLSYLARCQCLLQKGQFIADVAYLGSENAPNSFPDRESMDPALPPGYDFDDLPPEVLLKQATVQAGRLVLKSGMSYGVLVLPPGRSMTPALLAKVKELVVEGATVVGPRPSASPSLADYPRCDSKVQQLAEDLWGECDGESITENRCGDGKVIWGRPLGEVLRAQETGPDFACHDVAVGKDIHYIHRRVDGDEVYFLASGVPEARRFLCTFRVQGKQPELWWPDSGRIEVVALYDERDGNTVVPLTLDPFGSVFLVLRAGATPLTDRVVSLRRGGVEISGLTLTPAPEIQLQQEAATVHVIASAEARYRLEAAQAGTYELKTAAGRTLKVEVPSLPTPFEIGGPWELEFPKGLGAPERVTLEHLISWTEHPDPGVKYFSGMATYHRQFDLPEGMLGKNHGMRLDLGRVAVIVEITLNGNNLGICWKPPFQVDVTEILRVGRNDLVVSVVNLWPNRLIGDEQLPEDCEWAPPSSSGNPVPKDWGKVLGRWPQWLLENKPSPTGRVAFTTWKHWAKDDPLLESGLLGPVRIIARAIVPVE